MMEILAPVGGQEQLIAAVRCGADAVYLGAKGFNARRNAANFDDAALEDSVRYCHQRGVKVFVTVNTLVTDDELPALYATCDEVAQSGADGVILQDLAAAAYFRDHYPTIRRVASTQMAVHNVEGARALKDMGFSRMVLVRETTLDEMRKINQVGLEMESFVHGALCVCLSGACYFSSMLGGRSGNRGLCAQPCRLDFHCRGRDHALSMKDLSYLSRLKDLEAAGVKSLKIEGRMKRPEYVAAAVTACRKALDGEKYDEKTLQSVFSRSGFTQGYLDGKRNLDMYGIRRKEDVEAAGKVLGELAGLYRAERASIPVNMRLEITETGAKLEVTDLGADYGSEAENQERKPGQNEGKQDEKCGYNPILVEGGAPFAAERPVDAEKSLSKTGGTPFFLNSLEVVNPLRLGMRTSELNELRRVALDRLLEKRGMAHPHRKTKTDFGLCRKYTKEETEVCNNNTKQTIVHKREEIWGRFADIRQIPENEDFGRIILPLGQLGGTDWEKAVCELPPVLFPEDEESYIQKLAAMKGKGLRAVYAENLYGVALGKKMGFETLGGAGLNILNGACAEEYAQLGLDAATISFECAMKKADELRASIPLGLVVYGRLPLMRLRCCPARGRDGCGKCQGRSELTDSRGARFPIICGGRKYVTVHNSVPLHIADKQIADVDYRVFYFTGEGREECARILAEYRERRPSVGERTGGLYYRTLL